MVKIDDNVARKTYHKKLLNKKSAQDKNSFSEADTVSYVYHLLYKDMVKELMESEEWKGWRTIMISVRNKKVKQDST